MSKITPFNAQAFVRASMYKRKLPEVLWMPVLLYHLPGVLISPLISVAGQMEDYLVNAHKLTDIERHCIVPMVQIIEMPQCASTLLQPRQKNWMVGPVYLQAGYYDESGVGGIARSVACAMTISDTCTCLSGVLHPDVHVPLSATDDDVEEYERTVRNHYRSGVGVWSEHLVNHRNQILIRSRAVMSGTDPDIVWEQFETSRQRSFLFAP